MSPADPEQSTETRAIVVAQTAEPLENQARTGVRQHPRPADRNDHRTIALATLSYAEVSAVLKYEPESGKLFWLHRPLELCASAGSQVTWNKRFSGREALCAVDAQGYLVGRIFGRNFKAHRVAWLLQTGKWPDQQVDHIDGCKSNNRWVNLRDVSQTINSRNSKMRSHNTSGFNGVYWREKQNKWIAIVHIDRKMKRIGTFDDPITANSERLKFIAGLGYTERHGLLPERLA